MPVVSKAQERAMWAAKEGHSTPGIPKKVGAEFIAATPKGAKLPERKDSCPVTDYLGACAKGDSAGMVAHSKKMRGG